MRFHGREAASPTRREVAAALLVGLLVQPFVGGVASAQLANAPWPMAHGNPQHTGRSAYVGPSSSPTVRWQVRFPGLRSSPVIGPDGTVYVSSRRTFYAFDPIDGSERWSSQLPAIMRRNSAALDVNGRIFIGARDNRLWALGPAGQPLWFYTVGNDGDVNTSAAIAPDGTVYMVGTWNGIVHALKPDNGNLLWKLSTGEAVIYSSPALGLDGTVYVGTTKGQLYATMPGGDDFKWKTHVGRIRFGAPAVGADGTVYIGSREGLSAVDPDGNLLWRFDTGAWVASTPAIAADGTIYVGSFTAFHAVDPQGNELWRYEAGERRNGFYGSPVIDANGDIYVSSGKRLISLDQSGNLRWVFLPNRPRKIISTPAIGADGSLYLAADQFYALED